MVDAEIYDIDEFVDARLSRTRSRFGEWIRERRRQAGLTQMQLAVAAGVNVGVVRGLEQGISCMPRVESAQRLLKALGAQAGAPPPRAAVITGARQPASRPAAAAPALNELLLLGQLQFRRNGQLVALGSPRQQAVLALIALRADAPVSREAFLEVLWDGAPPPTAIVMIQSHVSKLRKLLASDLDEQSGLEQIVRVGAGYALRTQPGQLDSAKFVALRAQARAEAEQGNLDQACAVYEEALSLWRGEPLAGLDILRDHPSRIALNRQWGAAVIDYAAVAIKLRNYDRVQPHLQALADREPLNERAHAYLMVILAGTGHQALAIEMFEGIRRRLGEQLGLSPSAELREAHARVLRQQIGDPAESLITW